ncbi:hypothetical protein [Metabacillus sediminilitoris]|uniref:Uncharacterized protein n=1 Tax=Metabacillus sediminilitoris TaxID=2567941 RepID=A0A4S4BRQ9_9BACI|nr:hypothetical protein [Metabacillus sediminilitoris]QGQ45442.1 hypothetical protein GMB29_09360 [Metabacillus sediminilitoris]THF77701.1 hypothetical protein E6W99_18570 [Metabacillus sediminilitoris]
MTKSILWFTGHYTNEFCKQKAVEIKEKIKTGDEDYKDYAAVRIVDKVLDYDKDNNLRQYNRLRLVYK